MQSQRRVLRYAVVEGRRAPGLREEDEADGLAEVVEAEPRGADGGEDGGVGEGACGDGRGVVAAAQGEVGVGGCAEGVADDEEGDVFGGGVGEDGVGVGFDGFAVGEEDGAAVVGFLCGWGWGAGGQLGGLLRGVGWGGVRWMGAGCEVVVAAAVVCWIGGRGGRRQVRDALVVVGRRGGRQCRLRGRRARRGG